MHEETVYLNGQWLAITQAKVSVLDRGFLFGDAVYEVIPVYQNKPFAAKEHLMRLQQSLDACHINYRVDMNSWQQHIADIVARNAKTLGASQLVYLQISRGANTSRAHLPNPAEPTLFIYTKAWQPPSIDSLSKGCKVITHKDIRWQWCHIKSVNLLANTLLLAQAKEQGADEVILLSDDNITEAASSNVFIVSDGEIITRPLSSRILAGVTRDFVIALAKKLNFSVIQRPFSYEQLCQAEEVWLTSASREITPVYTIDHQHRAKLSSSSLWHSMMQSFHDYRLALSR